MRELAEFRVPERNAQEYLPKDIGERLGDSVRKVVVETHDPLFDRIGALSRAFRSRGEHFFHGWDVRRTFSKRELEEARAFHVVITVAFQPAGEEFGTIYDENAGCPVCSSGRVQLTALRLNTRVIPKRADFARSIAFDEIVVSGRVKSLLKDVGATGVELHPVEHVGRARRSSDWFQLCVISPFVNVVPPTRFGVKIFEEDAVDTDRCPVCTTSGLNLLSQVSIAEDTWSGSDFAHSLQFVGKRSGALRPRRLLFVSPRIRGLFAEHKLRGARFEVANLVDN